MDTLQLPAQMQAPAWLKDDSVSIKLVTSREISDEQFVALSKYKKVNGWFLFQPNAFQSSDLPTTNAPAGTAKYTRAQRLRWKLTQLHLNRGGTKETADAYYNKKMDEFEHLIDEALA